MLANGHNSNNLHTHVWTYHKHTHRHTQENSSVPHMLKIINSHDQCRIWKTEKFLAHYLKQIMEVLINKALKYTVC